jgi:hypothetical protein
MSLSQLYQDLVNSTQAGTLTLDKNSRVPAEMLHFLDDLPAGQLVIHQADLVLNEKSAPPVLGVNGSTVGSWPIAGVADSGLRPTSVSLAITDAGDETLKIDAKLAGTISVGNSEWPVRGSLTEQGTWALELADDKQQVSPAHLLAWAGGSSALAALTSKWIGLPVADPTAIEVFSLELGVGSEPQCFLSCELALAGRITILQGLPAVDLLSAGVSVIHYASSTKTPQSGFAFSLRAKVRIGSGSYVVAFRNLGGIGHAVAKILPDNGLGLPSLDDLAALVGAAELSPTFFPTIKNLALDGFAITGAELSFDAESGVPALVSVSGAVQIAGTAVEVFCGIPGFRLSGQLARGQLDIAGLIKHFWPAAPSLPSLRISIFAVSADIAAGSLTVYGEIGDAWEIDMGAAKLTVGNMTLQLTHTCAGQKATTAASLSGLAKVQGVEVALYAELSDAVAFSGYIPHINLTALVREFLSGTSVPAALPDVELFDVELSATPATGAFSISGQSSGTWGFPAGGGGLAITDVCIGLRRNKAEGEIDCFIQISGQGPAQPTPGLAFGDFALRFELTAGGQWQARGNLAAQLFGYGMNLAADFSAGDASRAMSFSWSATPAPVLLSIDDTASLSLSGFTVSLAQAAGGEGRSSLEGVIAGTGRITIGKSLFASDFDLQLSSDDGDNRLVFTACNPTPIRVSLNPVAGHQPVFELALSEIQATIDSSSNTWTLTANARGTLHDIPEIVQHYFPADLPDGRLGISDKGIFFDCILAKPLTPECRMFAAKVEGREFLPQISIAQIGASLGETTAVRGTLHVELPPQLNYFLGADPNTGKPKFEFLNPAFDLALSLGKGLSLALANGTSPFRALNYKTDAKGDHLDWNSGELGIFRVDMPTLTFEENAWSGTAGVELPSPLKLPLRPVKYILGLLHFPPDLLDYIPDSVPVEAFDFTDLAGSLEKFLGRNAVAQIKKDKLLAEPLADFETLSKQFKKIISRLPADFEGYLQIPEIKELRLKLGATPGGGPIIGLHTDDAHPLKVMLPWFAGVPPGFLGVTLHSLDVGQTVGGAVLAKIHGVIDQFDLISLVVAGTGIIAQEQARSLKNEITLDKATLILWPALPVPIPLTYATLNWNYQAWTGFKLFADWHLRERSNLFAVIASLIPFFSDPAAKLHVPPNDKDFALDLTIGPNFIVLPDYLGGAVLGLQKELPAMDLAYGLKCFLDAVKFGNAGYLIQAVPLRNPLTDAFIRIGSQKGGAGFGPLRFEAALGWCITTEDEFRNKIVPDKDAQKLLGELDADTVLDNLPAKSGPAYDKGFIVLLMARGGLAGILEYGTNFGMAVTAAGGFATRLMMQGRIADRIALGLSGLVKVSRHGVTTVEGECRLTFDETELIGSKQTITVSDHSFELEAELRLLDAAALSGDFYIGQDQVYLKGTFSWGYAEGQTPMGARDIFARFNATGFEIGVGTAGLFGTNCAEVALFLDVAKPTPIGARAWLDDLGGLNAKLGLSIERYQSEIDRAAADAQNTMNQALADLQSNIGGFDDLRLKLPAYLQTLRTVTIPGLITARVKSAYRGLTWLQKQFVKEADIRNAAQTYFQQNFAPRIKRLEDGLNNITSGDETARNAQTRALLQQMLQAVIDIGNIKYTYRKTVGKTFSKTITIPDPVKPFRGQLQDLKNIIGRLPASWSQTQAAEAGYAAKDKIRQAIDVVVMNLDEQIPRIESVRLELPLVFTAPSADAYVTMQYAGKPRSLDPVRLDLGNPVKSIDSITEAFARLLSADRS